MARVGISSGRRLSAVPRVTAHVVTGMRIDLRRRRRSRLHAAHVVTGVRVCRSRRGGAHGVARMRINSGRLGRGRGRRRGATRLGRGDARFGLGRGPRAGLLRAGGRGLGAVASMSPVALGDGGTGGQHQGQNRNSGEQGAAHRAAPSIGRTVTTLNIPACMCISRWQWKAQSPGASAVRSKVTFEPGATLTVCFSG